MLNTGQRWENILLSRTHLIIPDPHAHPDHHNKRADYLAGLIIDLRPDVVVCIGDGPDMPSLASYDRGTRSFQGRTYRRDIDAWLDFQSRMWDPVRARKKRLPERHYLEGNHDYRIKRAINFQPELDGAIGFDDLCLNDYWDVVTEYNGATPGTVTIDGVTYAHYFVSGVMGRAITGERPALALVNKQLQSTTQGHVHTFDHCLRTNAQGKKISGLVCGCYVDYPQSYAGISQRLWYPGVVIKREVEDGVYDLQTVSMETLKRIYG